MSDPSPKAKHAADQRAELDPERVEKALEHLSHRDSEALLLKTREGLSYAQIGALLGLGGGEAEARVASALVELHARLMRPPRPWWRFW